MLASGMVMAVAGVHQAGLDDQATDGGLECWAYETWRKLTEARELWKLAADGSSSHLVQAAKIG